MEEAKSLKEQLSLMNNDNNLDIKDFKDEADHNVFKDALELKKQSNVSTFYITSPTTKLTDNPYKKSPASYSSVDTKRGGWVKKMIEGGSPQCKPLSLGPNFDRSNTLTAFSENLKKSAVQLLAYRFFHPKAKK